MTNFMASMLFLKRCFAPPSSLCSNPIFVRSVLLSFVDSPTGSIGVISPLSIRFSSSSSSFVFVPTINGISFASLGLSVMYLSSSMQSHTFSANCVHERLTCIWAFPLPSYSVSHTPFASYLAKYSPETSVEYPYSTFKKSANSITFVVCAYSSRIRCFLGRFVPQITLYKNAVFAFSSSFRLFLRRSCSSRYAEYSLASFSVKYLSSSIRSAIP